MALCIHHKVTILRQIHWEEGISFMLEICHGYALYLFVYKLSCNLDKIIVILVDY